MRKCIVRGVCVLALFTALNQQRVSAQIYGPDLIQDGTFAQLFGGGWSGTAGFPNTFYGDADGNGYYVTLLADEPALYQYVPTVTGDTYQLTFASRIPNPAEAVGNTGPNGQPLGPWTVEVELAPFARTAGFTDNSDTVWSFFTVNFTATSSSTYVGFLASGPGSPEFDDVSMYSYATPEPATLGLLALGATALLSAAAGNKSANVPEVFLRTQNGHENQIQIPRVPAAAVGASLLLAFGAHAQNLYVADNSGDVIDMFTPDGTKGTFARGVGAPGEMAFNTAGRPLRGGW